MSGARSLAKSNVVVVFIPSCAAPANPLRAATKVAGQFQSLGPKCPGQCMGVGALDKLLTRTGPGEPVQAMHYRKSAVNLSGRAFRALWNPTNRAQTTQTRQEARPNRPQDWSTKASKWACPCTNASAVCYVPRWFPIPGQHAHVCPSCCVSKKGALVRPKGWYT